MAIKDTFFRLSYKMLNFTLNIGRLLEFLRRWDLFLGGWFLEKVSRGLISKQYKHTAKLPEQSSLLKGFKIYFLVTFFFWRASYCTCHMQCCVILYHFKLVMRRIVKSLAVANVTYVTISCFTYFFLASTCHCVSEFYRSHVLRCPIFLKEFMYIRAFTEVYLEPRRTSTMEFFCENSQRLLVKKINRRCLTGF